MIRVLVCGSRQFDDYTTFVTRMDLMFTMYDLKGRTDVEIVAGGARGPDAMAVQYACHNNIPYIEMPADWDRYGKSAGYRRNEKMAAYCMKAPQRFCFAFWDGQSRGTEHMLNTAFKNNFVIRVVNV